VIVAAAVLGLGAAKLPLAAALRRGVGEANLECTLGRARALWPFALGLAAAFALLLELKANSLNASAAAAGRSFREVILFSPRPADFLDRAGPSPVYPGVVALALAAAGLWASTGRALALVAALAAVLTLGSHAPQGLPLYRIAFELVPFFSMIRQSTKFFAVGGLALSLAAGVGFDRLQAAIGERPRRLVFAAALAALLVDYSAVLPVGLSAMPEHNRAYSIVAERGQGTNLLELPLWPGDSHYSSIYLYWALQTKVPAVNGYNPTVFRDYIDRVDHPLEAMNLGEMTEAQYRLMRDLGVKLVTLHSEVFPPKVSPFPYRFTLSAMKRNPNLEYLDEDQGVFLFALKDGEYRPFDGATPSPLGVFFEAETLLGFATRIADPGASGGIFVRGEATQPPLPVVFGPHRTFPRGRYRVRFRTSGTGRIEVTARGARELLASGPVASSSFADAMLDFELDEPKSLEFRAWPAETGTLDVDWLLVRKLDRSGEPLLGRIEAEDLRPVLEFDVASADASNGAFAVVGGPAGSVVRDGPYKHFAPGPLHLAVRGRGAGFRVDVESADGRRRYADLVVPASEHWTTAETDLELPQAEVLCTRIVSTGLRADADWVELRRAR